VNAHLDKDFVERISNHLGLPFQQIFTKVRNLSGCKKAEVWRRLTKTNGKGKSHMSGKVLEGDLKPGKKFKKRKMRRRW